MTSQTQTPTTFVQADTASFRHLVQQLTGLSGDTTEAAPPANLHSKLSSKTSNRRSSFKLQDRRGHALRNNLEIKLGLSALALDHHRHSPRKTYYTDTPHLSPVTPLGSDSAFLRGTSAESPSASEEEKAIAQKGFYLHPSPASTPRGAEPPELLPLFPTSLPEQERTLCQ